MFCVFFATDFKRTQHAMMEREGGVVRRDRP